MTKGQPQAHRLAVGPKTKWNSETNTISTVCDTLIQGSTISELDVGLVLGLVVAGSP